MIEFVMYPVPPHEDQPVPQFEVFVDYQNYTWSCILPETDDEHDGTFSINHFTESIHIEWYGIPKNTELWEAVNEELRSLILCHIR